MAKRKALTESASHQSAPWERQEGEQSAAFAAFVVYRDALPKIGAAKVAQKINKSLSVIEAWCTKYRWKERREAWEDELDRISREEFSKGVTAMRKRHIEIATEVLDEAHKAFERIGDKAVTLTDIARAVEIAAKLERISRGEATERTENRTEIAGEVKVSNLDLSALSDEDLKRLDEIVSKIPAG